jgi:predicted ArsR family transcriptional regulator
VVKAGRTTRIRLTHCPFLELAEEHQQVVCSVHHGLMQGVLDEIDAPIEAYDVEPFAEPTACLVHLRRRAETKRVSRD